MTNNSMTRAVRFCIVPGVTLDKSTFRDLFYCVSSAINSAVGYTVDNTIHRSARYDPNHPKLESYLKEINER